MSEVKIEQPNPYAKENQIEKPIEPNAKENQIGNPIEIDNPKKEEAVDEEPTVKIKGIKLDLIEEEIDKFNRTWDTIFENNSIGVPKGQAKGLPKELNERYEKAAQVLITTLYNILETDLKEQEAENFQVYHLWRHGESTDSKKGFGFKPNANINANANENMKHFKFSALVHNKESSSISFIFSTMTRATATAARFIAGLGDDYLVFSKSSRRATEVAEGPSGFGIEEASEYGALMNPYSGVKLSHRIMLFFSFVAYVVFGNTLAKNEAVKSDSLGIIGEKSLLEKSSTAHSSDVIHTSDEERRNGVGMEIVEQMKASNDKKNKDTNDVFLVGHGNSIRNTLTALFPNYKDNYNLKGKKKDALKFAEGQGLMAFDDAKGDKKLMMLPFRIQVDQHTPGKMNIRYTPYAEIIDYKQAEEKILAQQKEIDAKVKGPDDQLKQNASYVTMMEGGLTQEDQEEEEKPLVKEVQHGVINEPEMEFDPEDIELREREFKSN